jgi:hypothetical protein
MSVLSLVEQLDRTRQELQDENPGWQIWYVFHPHGGHATWHARRNPQLSAPDPDALRKAISEASCLGTQPSDFHS